MQVSVVIPTYNRADLVCEAVDSALAEVADGNGEVIVVDDGSTDATAERLESYKQRIRYLATANRGVSAARNTGLAMASGRYVRFLDSDDLITAGSTGLLLRAFDRTGADAIIGLRGKTGAKADYPVPEVGIDESNRGNWIKAEHILWHGLQVGAAMFRKDRLVEIAGFDEQSDFGEDYDLIFRGLAAEWRIFLLPDTVCMVRSVAAERLSADPAAHQFLYFSEMMERVTGQLGPIFERDENARRVFGRWIWYMGRVAARRGFRVESARFFSLATQIAGSTAMSGHPVVRSLYRLFDPFFAEIVSTRLKALLRRDLHG